MGHILFLDFNLRTDTSIEKQVFSLGLEYEFE